jgi:lipopolysaccharide/colanic/teichoic acid biosynthesis glycosyltransferase
LTVKTLYSPVTAAAKTFSDAWLAFPKPGAQNVTRERRSRARSSDGAVHVPLGFAYRNRPSYAAARRVLSVAVALVAIVVTSPIVAAAALLIKIEDGGPIFFSQRRVGRFGKLFPIYKLRTMRTDACSDALKPNSSKDARITTVGRSLRKLSIDELPQLFNILRGDMCLVGPRPEMPFIVSAYEPWQHLRHLETPGITGLWQVTSRKTIPLQHPKATALDLEYIRAGSPLRDLKILVRTVRSLLSTRGVH